ncbi:MAG TPA: secretin N-terminal domain-containing protein [Chthoniobacterales bacterium]|nr:secretin N-terminal domain-containing protein [Chthoniobacterales bacterium]
MLSRPLLGFLVFPLAMQLSAQQIQTTPPPGPSSGDELVSYEASNAPITAVLQEYEKLTGKTLIEDSNLMANAVPLTISLPHPVKKSQLIRLIEAALLLNNYALIPGPGENTMKVINLSTGKNARSEGVRLYTSPEDMPIGEEIVSYYMPLDHISANEALTVFNTHILPRAYTSFVPITSAQAVVITETTNVIRQLIALKNLIDVPPAATSTVFVQLLRADAERVADTLSKLLDGGQQRAPVPQQGQNVVIANPGGGTVINGLQAQLIADTRTNRILIVTRPQNMETLRSLVEAFDQAVPAAQPLEYKLRYISAGEALPVLSDVLTEEYQATGGAGGTNQQQNQQQQVPQNRTVNLGGRSSSSMNPTQTGTSAGGYSSVSSSAGSVGAGQDLLQEPNEQLGPQSVIVGKTRIISDAKDNKIIVIGPPESIQKVRTILERLDRRPQQVYLSTVIGQLSLNNENDFGVDFTQTYKKISDNAGIASSNLSSTGTQAGIFNQNGQIAIDPRQILGSGLVPGTQGLAIYGSITDAIRVFVRAVDTWDKLTILARPAVYTANNKRAVISSGQRVPVPGTTLSNVSTNNILNTSNTAAVQSTIEYEDVELRLEVIPLINSSREVTLKIAQINDSLGNNVTIAGNTVPIVNSQRLTTTVTVPSGATVVLGGLINDQISKNESGVPVVDQLPYLGNFFKFQTHTRKRTELLVFIQPTVVESNIETLRASLKEEKRTKVGSDMSSLANPEDYASPAPDENARRRRPDK